MVKYLGVVIISILQDLTQKVQRKLLFKVEVTVIGQDGSEAAKQTISDPIYINRPNETIWIKDPWYKRDGDDVQDVSIKGI